MGRQEPLQWPSRRCVRPLRHEIYAMSRTRAVKVYPGEALWVVYEHFYYPAAGALVQKEYCVVRMVVEQVNEYGWMALREAAAGGRGYWTKMGTSSIGTLAFRSAAEAARRAEALTDREDRVWGGMGGGAHAQDVGALPAGGPAPAGRGADVALLSGRSGCGGSDQSVFGLPGRRGLGRDARPGAYLR